MRAVDFERLVRKAVESLPKAFRDKMRNVAVVTSRAPSRDQRRRFGGGLLGLYEGIPLSERTSGYGGVMPDKITLFRKNIEAECPDPERIPGVVRHALMHEVAHHFGMTDEELLRKGLY